MPNIFARLKALIYPAPKEPTLSAEEAASVADRLEKALMTMRSNVSWAQVEVNAAVAMCRSFPKGTPRHEHYRRILKLRLVMQQYMEKMNVSLETVSSQVRLARLTSDMGVSLQNATALVNTYNRDIPSFSGFARKFLETLGPINEELDGGLDEFTAALDQLSACTLEDVYAEEDLDALISGTAPSIEPVLPEKPAGPAEADDLLATLEKQLLAHPMNSKTE